MAGGYYQCGDLCYVFLRVSASKKLHNSVGINGLPNALAENMLLNLSDIYQSDEKYAYINVSGNLYVSVSECDWFVISGLYITT